ncbi:MAG: DNA helicase PcrA [Clostridia bacterium]|jgi:DNA helicase-2/ATP-dependent DNA helicase PcrA|nr:DNA helicase PcrA [Clostridia bacterium]MCI2014635.1 DNA helicase PcrA [Clostridia bacterium]
MIEFEKLNPMQKKAVMQQDGPVLILAGAGSGKTGALTVRVANLIENGVKPWNILAITFTNKAAKEMRDRIVAIESNVKDIWVSTFHSACVRILRRDIEKIGYERNFSIYDPEDSQKVMRDIFLRMNLSLSDKTFTIKGVLSEISKAKEELVSPSKYMQQPDLDFRQTRVGEVYREYQKKLKKNNAVDFDDIIFNTVLLFQLNPDVLNYYQEKFKYIMVDEYQDTNTSQYSLVKLLADKYKNLCVVGDDDQSIYGWRGANIRNILDFEKDFPNATVIKLEQNYRSTQMILDAANSVIKNNDERKEKSLWTENQKGSIIKAYCAENEYDEGRFIAKTIDEYIAEGQEYKNFAVLYRTNAQSRVIEEQLIRKNIPYRLCGGVRFYDRKEIRDIHSYLKMIANPNDDIAIKRIINVPKRGIGATSVEKVSSCAIDNGLSFYDAIPKAVNDGICGRSAKNFEKFYELAENFKKDLKDMTSAQIIDEVAKRSGYINYLELEGTEEAKMRLENIEEFVSKATEYIESTGDISLEGFLQEVALVADVDSYSEDENAVVLMTLHSAKGLEFPIVFMSGMEEGLFPSYRSTTSPNSEHELQEERRLCYVGITRAREELWMTFAKTRMQHGNMKYNRPSRFLDEIPADIIKWIKNERTNSFGIPFASAAPKKFSSIAAASGLSYGLKKSKSEIPAPKDFTLSFSVGDKVRAPKYGIGTVKDISPAGADFEVEVSFAGKGSRKFMARLSKLIKVD